MAKPTPVQSLLKFVPRPDFWGNVLDWNGDGGQRRVHRPVIAFVIFATVVYVVDYLTPGHIDLGMAVAPYEYAGAILGSLLVLRTNEGLGRWWEARKLWGGITNQSRNLAVIALTNGPNNPSWRHEVVSWIAAFAHVTRRSLRGERDIEEVAALVGTDEAGRIAQSQHMPTAVSLKIGSLLRMARDRGELDSFAFLEADGQRGMLIDHLGGCERIHKTPLPAAYVVLIRRFIVLFLMTLPFALLRRVEWQTPIITLMVAYPILALDQIADDLQHPFSKPCINHLPLDDISYGIEANLLALLPVPEETLEADSRLTPVGVES